MRCRCSTPTATQSWSAHADIPILLETDAAGAPTVDDFAYLFTDGNDVSYWKLASGDDVRDAEGNVIEHPTFEDVMAQAPTNGAWTLFTGDELGFMERFLGQPIPLDQLPEHPDALLASMTSFLSAAYSAMELEAVRLAMQGPLASYFPDVVYNAETNKFSATSDAQLTPMYAAIFAAAPADAPGAESWLSAWKPIINVVLGDFDRGEGGDATYGYMFASMVRAFEGASLPLAITAAAEALGVPSDLIVTGGTALVGSEDSDIFYLSGGDQSAAGGRGLDNYVLGHAFAHVTIDDDEAELGDQDPDIIRFTDINAADVNAADSRSQLPSVVFRLCSTRPFNATDLQPS